MSLYWIYDFPNWQMGILIVVVFNVVAVGGFFLTRPLVGWMLGGSNENNDVVSFFFAGVGVFYGLALGLIAVATWEDFTGIDATVGKEAASLAALYRDLDGYPAPVRTRLETALRDYTRFVIETEWPAHRKGLAPEDGTLQLDRFEDDLMSYEPANEHEKINHGEALRSLNEAVEGRRLRLQSVGTGLPMALWSVVLIGALLNIAPAYLFRVENRLLHALLIGFYATFIGLLVFLTAAMDNPFLGDFSVSPDAIKTVLDTVMKP